MAIQPIDAQVLFSRINQLGKEQAEQKDGQLHTQAVAGAQIAKRAEEAGRRVSAAQAAEDAENIRQIKDEERRGGGQRGDSAEEETEEEETAAGRKEFLREAYLGKKIDITG